MPRPAWFEIYSDWCLRSGRPASRYKPGIVTSGRPQLPMSPTTVKDYIWRTQRILGLTTPIYLEPMARNGHMNDNGKALKYRVVRDIRQVRPEELMSGINALFPEGIRDEVAADYRHYKLALISLGRYLVYEMLDQHNRPVWTPEDLVILREMLPTEKVVYAQVEIMEPALFDEFLAWLKDAEPSQPQFKGYRELHDFAFALRWMGYRYSGARGAPVKLDGRKTMKKGTTKLSRGTVTITEKPPNPVRTWTAPEVVFDFLKERQAYMAKNWPTSPWLFVNSRGGQYYQNSATFNRSLRRAFIRFHKEVKGSDPDEADLEACHAHALRHICGTYWILIGVDFPTVKNYLGHRDYKTMELYVGHVARLKGAADMMNKAMTKWNKENGQHGR